MTTEPHPASRARFHTTLWDVVRVAGDGEDPARGAALEELCRRYWYPLYAYLRRNGEGTEDASDLVQGFFASFLARDDLSGLDPDGGRFRSYLLGALRHYASDQRDHDRAEKRGGGRTPVSIQMESAEERYASAIWSIEPADERTPERLFDRDWALATLARVLERLRDEQTGRRAEVFARLRCFLDGSTKLDGYASAAEELGMTSGAVKVAVHRLRRRYRELLEQEVRDTLPEGGEVEPELRALFEALS
ncbi:MAG: sigma-70 family RNA polymerase sigma factor [bacterium]|nr:sigma-70 family RNA polymerase sigma factor [bacterium]